MALDDLALGLQRAADRLLRRLQIGPPPPRARRRFLVVQIDGLSRAVLEEALASGRMPFVARLVGRHGHHIEPMSVGLPSSTPAFQMAAMYGVSPDIPGFHYHDKRRREDVHFPRPGHAARVEAEHSAGRVGILRGGSVYGCVFTGGADNSLWSFARLTRPRSRGVWSAFAPFIVVGWVAVKSLALSLVELARAGLRFVADPLGFPRHWAWLKLRLAVSVWVRQLFTLAAARDIYGGVPGVYVNYLDYDVAAHAFGPKSRRALGSLRSVDRSLRQLWRVLRRVPEHQYDFFVLSDHGQIHCVPYARVAGAPLDHIVLDHLVAGSRARARVTVGRSPAYQHGLRAYGIGRSRRARRAPAGRESAERDGIRVIAAGNNAFLYVVDASEPLLFEDLESRLPGLVEALSRSPGVGFLLCRSREGPLCYWRGRRVRLDAPDEGPFAGREDRAVLVDDAARLMAMRSAGDVVIYGVGAPEGHVSFIPEIGAHAGPSTDEMHTFLIRPPAVAVPSPITHPLQLYPFFLRYQDPDARP